MDLSQIPLVVLKAEHDFIDTFGGCNDYLLASTPICKTRMDCPSCAVHDGCAGLVDPAPGWPERKERYLLALRVEIERRSACE